MNDRYDRMNNYQLRSGVLNHPGDKLFFWCNCILLYIYVYTYVHPYTYVVLSTYLCDKGKLRSEKLETQFRNERPYPIKALCVRHYFTLECYQYVNTVICMYIQDVNILYYNMLYNTLPTGSFIFKASYNEKTTCSFECE